MSNETSVRSSRQKIGLVLGIVLFLLVLAAPTPEGMSPEAKRMAAVAVLMGTWWISEAIAIALTALLPLALLPLLGVMPSVEVAPRYADHVIFLFFGGFVVALAIQKWNLHRRIALRTILMVGAEPSRQLSAARQTSPRSRYQKRTLRFNSQKRLSSFASAPLEV